MKKLFALMMVCMMLMGFSLSVCAEDSPSATPVEPSGPSHPQEEEPKVPSSPQTGESDIFAYGMVVACISAGVVTIAASKVRE